MNRNTLVHLILCLWSIFCLVLFAELNSLCLWSPVFHNNPNWRKLAMSRSSSVRRPNQTDGRPSCNVRRGCCAVASTDLHQALSSAECYLLVNHLMLQFVDIEHWLSKWYWVLNFYVSENQLFCNHEPHYGLPLHPWSHDQGIPPQVPHWQELGLQGISPVFSVKRTRLLFI